MEESMKSRLSIILSCLILSIACFAQAQMPTGQWFYIHQEVVKPSMIKQYEDTSREFAAFVKANQQTMPHFHYIGIAGDDFTYTFVLPISKMADVDSVMADFAAMGASPNGSKFMDIMQHGNAAVEFTREFVVGEMPEYSYTPAAPRLKPEEEKYYHYDFYYFNADKNAEAFQIAKEFKELATRKNSPAGYKIYTSIMGPEMPVIVVRSTAKDPADYYALDMKDRELLGDEGKALFERAFAITRRFDSKGGWIRPDLSTMIPADTKKK
jgi:hypothetical protein